MVNPRRIPCHQLKGLIVANPDPANIASKKANIEIFPPFIASEM
ncbi:MAG TPA: hypothetical protein VLM88_03505 [Proteiniclasticum sp.]|nr:hypothetical protein [Proteiniclasticum sp.]